MVLIHPERGEMALLDVVRANTHDAQHHLWDIERARCSGRTDDPAGYFGKGTNPPPPPPPLWTLSLPSDLAFRPV